MKLTPLQRRERIYKIAEANQEYARARAEYDAALASYEKFTRKLPRKLCSFLWTFPGMGYFVYHRMLDIICENMVFPDEK